MKHISYIIILVCFLTSCQEDMNLQTNTSEVFWVEHDEAQMPVWVEGNTESKKIILVLHGGPAGDGSRGYNLNDEFAVPLEERYAVAYWDQRGSGVSKGNYDESRLNVDQFVEDLDKVVDVLYYRYGNDIDLYLFGNSWGGFLGNAYLIDEGRQSKIKGWIEVDGQHDFGAAIIYAEQQMRQIANEQIQAGNSVDYWNRKMEELNDINVQNPSDDDHAKMNRLGYQFENRLRLDDVLTREFYLEERAGFDYFFHSPYHPITSAVNSSQTNKILFEQITRMSLTDELHRISLPSLILWGKYDTVTPTQLAYDQYDLISTADDEKKLVILETAGHQSLVHQPSTIVAEIISFID